MRRAIFWLLTSGAICLCSPNADAQKAVPNGGGAGLYHLANSANTTNATNIKSSIGNVYFVSAINTTGAIYWLKFYDKATAPTCNSDPVVLSFPIPFGASSAGGGLVVPIAVGAQFLKGIGFCITANAADSDNTAAATGITVSVVYQ